MKTMLLIISCALSLVLLSGRVVEGALAPQEILQLERVQKFVFTPPAHDFGYSIGDVLVMTSKIVTPSRVSLDERSLPAGTKRINEWLELSVSLESANDGITNTYTIGYRYQIFFPPRSVERIEIPEYPLSFQDGKESFKVFVPSYSFLISPINKKNLTLDIAPDAKIIFPSLVLFMSASGLFLFSFTALLLLFVLPRMRYVKAFRTQSPFAVLGEKIHAAETAEEALLAIHGTLDAFAGHTCFADNMRQFLEDHPAFSGVEKELRDFFRISNGIFFAETGEYARGTMSLPVKEKLEALGRALYQASWKEAK